MQTHANLPEAQARRASRLDAQIAFCRTALDRGKTLAVRGELETASRTMWLVEDATDAIRPVLANVNDAERLDQYQTQLTQLLRDLSELRRYLCIPAGLA